ncbi:MAG: class I SAM-dependent methyltransferase [Myxococcota bacterium]
MVVTTTTKPTPAQRDRADRVGRRTGWPVVARRRGLDAIFAQTGASMAYVVGRDREELVAKHQRVAVDLGMLHAHRAVGTSHPLIQSVGPASLVIDATLGLCRDALHVAAVSGARIIGIEMSAALVCLAEEGLPRLAREEPAAAHIEPRLGDSQTVLRTLSADVVMLSPMFDVPQEAAPGFDILRALAVEAPLDEGWLEAAFSAAPRVIMKVRPNQPVPGFAKDHIADVRHGRAVDYWTLLRAPPGGAT